jgi:type I restriction enzyme S subunit
MPCSKKMVPLKDLGEIVSGSTPSTYRREYWNGEIPWITPADLSDHSGIYFRGRLRQITKAGFESCSTRILPPGSILYSSRAPIGHSAVTTYPLCTNQGFKSLIPNEKLNSEYGYFALKYYTPELLAMGRGATFSEINKEMFGNFAIPVPSITEQKRIAAILAKADRLRRLRRYALELGERYLQAVFVEMFGDPATNPMGWKRITIGDVVSSSQYGTSTKSNSENCGVPILGMANLTSRGTLDLSDLAHVEISDSELNELRLVPGDIIFNRTNSTELVGKTAYWNLEMQAVLASYLVRIRLHPTVTPEYFVALLNTSYFKSLFQMRCKKAVGQSNISPTLLKEFPITVPPAELQRQYGAIRQRMERVLAIERESVRQADHLFAAVIHDAFGGTVGKHSI